MTNAKIAKVPEFDKIASILNSIDWSFSNPFSVGRSGISLFDARKLHWYPATFVSEIPYTLIEILSGQGATVYDPFMGIGTSVFQSLILGRIPFGSDNNLISVELVRSLCSLLSPNVNLEQLLSVARSVAELYDPSIDYSSRSCNHTARFDLLTPWYPSTTLNQLHYLAMKETEQLNSDNRFAFKVVMSGLLKTVSAQHRGWGCISDNVFPNEEQLAKKKNATERFERGINLLVKEISKVKDQLPKNSQEFLKKVNPEAFIKKENVQKGTGVSKNYVDLIITSPPYPNMTDYTLSQRLTYYWLGLDPTLDLPSEIGARRKRYRHDSISTYKSEMLKAVENIVDSLKIGGYACFVMPVFSGDKINNVDRKQAVDEFIGSMSTIGLTRETVLTRIIPAKRRHHNQKWTTLAKENIHIFRKLT